VIVVGFCDKKEQKTMLVEENLTLTKTESICRVSEETEPHIRYLNKEESYVVDAFIKNKAKRAATKYVNQQGNSIAYDCTRCGIRHVFRNCPAFRKKCDNCSRKGRITDLCRVREVHTVAEGQDSSSSEEFLHIIGLESDSRKQINAISSRSRMGLDEWKQNVLINNVKITMKLDIGAECNGLPMHICEKLKLNVGTSNTKRLNSYSKHKIPVTGEVTTQCKVCDMERRITFKVILLLSRPTLQQSHQCRILGYQKEAGLQLETVTSYSRDILPEMCGQMPPEAAFCQIKSVSPEILSARWQNVSPVRFIKIAMQYICSLSDIFFDHKLQRLQTQKYL
jgi:hypothetical protein